MKQQVIASISIGSLIIMPIIASLYYFNVFKTDTKRKNQILQNFMIACATVLFFSVIFYEIILPQYQNLFYKGEVLQREVLIEPDDGTPYYGMVDYFKYSHKYPTNIKGLITLLMWVIFAGGFAFTYYFSSQTEKSMKSKDVDDNILETWQVNFFIAIRLVLSIGLLLCILNMPYWYYNVIRLVMVVGCCYLMIREHQKANFIGWIFLLLLILTFNPIYEVTFTRLLWNVIDISVAIILMAGAVKMYIDSKN